MTPTGEPAPPPPPSCTVALAAGPDDDDDDLAVEPLDEEDELLGLDEVDSAATDVALDDAADAVGDGAVVSVTAVVALVGVGSDDVVDSGGHVAAGSALTRGGGSSGFAVPADSQRQPSTIVDFTRTSFGPTLW